MDSDHVSLFPSHLTDILKSWPSSQSSDEIKLHRLLIMIHAFNLFALEPWAKPKPTLFFLRPDAGHAFIAADTCFLSLFNGTIRFNGINFSSDCNVITLSF